MLKSKNTEDLFSDACSSLSSLLENEKLFTTSFEDSSTDIDEEELRHGLEAYFKQLVPPEMQRGPTEGHEMPDPEVLGMSLNLDPFCQENFRMPAIRLAAAGMDSASVSEDEDTDLEVRLRTSPDMCCLPPKSGTQLTEDCDHSSLRPGLEGGSSDEGNGTGSRNHRSSGGTVRRRSAEGQVISSLVTGDCGGDGSGSEEDGSIGGTTQYLSFSADPQSSFTVHDLGNADRKIVGEENGDLETPRTNRESVPGHQEGSLDDTSVQNGLSDKMKLDSLYFQKGANNWTLSEQTDASLPPVCQPSFSLSQILPSGNGHEPSLRAAACGFAEIRNAGKNCGVWDNAEAGLAAIYLSPSRQSENATDGYDSVEQQQPSEEKVTWSLEQLETDNSSSHVVYQNEKGKWVTDLAYYTSFDKYVRSDLPDDMILQLQEEEFIGGADAAALIAEDEDEFRKEHVFIQEEKMDLQDVSLGLGDTSWRLPSCNYILMRASQAASEFGKEDKSYLRLSLGQFFSQRSEALGCLGGGDGVKRPSFGYRIVSPEKRAPVALIRPSDISYPSSTDSDYPRDNTLLPEDLEVFEKEESKITSATFLIPESPCLTSAKGKNVNGTEAEGGSAAVSKDQIAESALDLKTLSANKPSSTGDSILSLSTIASAINDVSVNTNVSQVVAVFTELINKKKQLASEGYGKNEVLDRLQLSVAEALLQTNLEHTMEKKAKAEYFDAVLRGEIPHLNSSEVMGMSAALQAHSGQDYYNKEKAKELSHAIDLHLKHRDFSGRNDAPQETVIGSAACYGGLSIGERREVVIAKGKAAVATHKVANVDERVGDGARSGYMKGKRSVPSLFGTQVKESKAGMKGPCLSEMATFTCETDADKDVSNNKEIRNTLTENPKEYPKRKSAKVKELSGETVSSTGSSMLPGIVPAGAKMISHGHEINNPEDNQYSFRPSTSPLIHSSPSQTSGIPESTKSLSGSPVYTSTSIQELGCSDVTSSDFTYSSVCLSTESYSSFTDDTLQNSATIRSPEKIEGLEMFYDSLNSSSKIDKGRLNVLNDIMEIVLNNNFMKFEGLAVVPEELNFATACCVGIAAQTSLRIHNPVDRWLQVSIGIVGISVNGEKLLVTVVTVTQKITLGAVYAPETFNNTAQLQNNAEYFTVHFHPRLHEEKFFELHY
ncbi:centrosomal protein of 192 kDa-like [Protopterus annectens]|uniref:centrosomal protein of 192 kDa-like n=1 Tax=Protopterus annectens TaxID=7888 RepID=UPI001CFAC774|nr:centrosomal protein of 192 kDa-like [Protopterus annectens]